MNVLVTTTKASSNDNAYTVAYPTHMAPLTVNIRRRYIWTRRRLLVV